LTARALETNGLIANMVEYPAVARFRFQVMATRTPEQIDAAARIFRRSLAEARAHLAE
jgi:7-keto-8-aminopelargonate synthetase-like enzyme